MNEAQQKNQRVQDAVEQSIAAIIAWLELWPYIVGTVPGFIWPGWGSQKTAQDVAQGDIEGLSLAQIKDLCGQATSAYTEAVEQ